MSENNFLKLSQINVNKHIEKVKSGSKENNYLSWAFAWSEFCKVYPKGKYDIKKDEKGLPFFGSGDLGYMVYVSVNNGEGLEHEMWLPVLDNKFNTLKDKPYEYTTKWGTTRVESINIFDINKALMRCLVKCIAMFGVGIYIYAGEDLPVNNEEESEDKEKIKVKEEKNKKNENKYEDSEFNEFWESLSKKDKEYYGNKYPNKFGKMQTISNYFKKDEKENIKKENSEKKNVKKELTLEEKKEKSIKMIESLCVKNGLKCDVERLNKMSSEELANEYNLLKGE